MTVRELRLRSSDEALAEIERLERVAERLSIEGSWSLGQVLAHCAQSIDYSIDGYPSARSALFRATVGRLAMRAFLRRGYLSHDVVAPIPGAPSLEPLSAAEGFSRLRAALARFAAFEGELAPHFAYGRVNKAEYDALHAMHLADHLSRVATG